MISIKNNELKMQARGLLNHHHRFFAFLTLLMLILDLGLNQLVNTAIPNSNGFLNLILFLITSCVIGIIYRLFHAGEIQIYLNLCRGRQMQINDLTLAFSHRPEQLAFFAVFQFILETIFINGIFYLFHTIHSVINDKTLLPNLLIVMIVGLVLIGFELALSMVYYLYCDYYYQSIFWIIRKSVRIMSHNKLRLMHLYLSFAGMYILAFLSFGIGLLFVKPYLRVSQTLFYLNLPEEDDL